LFLINFGALGEHLQDDSVREVGKWRCHLKEP
jgi:hypothetical protein